MKITRRKISKLLILIISLCYIQNPLLSAIITVNQNGTSDYVTIQEAINNSTDNDTILVYPGRYIENIDLNNHNVSIQSLYSVEAQNEYIGNTIIDGNLNSCIIIENGESVSISGFTISNNLDNINHQPPNTLHGGGLRIMNESSVQYNVPHISYHSIRWSISGRSG